MGIQFLGNHAVYHPLEYVDGFVRDDEFGGEVVEALVLCARHLFQGWHRLLQMQQFVLMVLPAELLVHAWYQLRHAGLSELGNKLGLVGAHGLIVTEQHRVDHGPRLKGIVACMR